MIQPENMISLNPVQNFLNLKLACLNDERLAVCLLLYAAHSLKQ